jgi:hypothetical protein
MNDFFANLIGRHLGTCDTIQPRTLGRFEPEHGRVVTATPEAITDSPEFEVLKGDQASQPLSETPDRPPKKIASEISSLESSVINSNHSIEPLNAVSADRSDSHAIPGTSYDTQLLNTEKYFQPNASAQHQPNKTPLAMDEHGSDRNVRTNINESGEVVHDKHPPPASRKDAYYAEHELNNRMNEMLQRLVGDLVQPNTKTVPSNRGGQKNESRISLPPEKKPPLPDATAVPLDRAPLLEPQAERQDSLSADDRDNAVLNARLEPPSWLPDMASQFNQGLYEKEAKTEPVINVTIGRVEVRAVQADAAKNSQRPKNPTGVMTLDEYLKQREGREVR